MPDLDSLLRPDLADTAADAAALPDFALIERRGLQRRRTRNRFTAVAAGAAAVLLVVGGTLLVGQEHHASLTPVAPSPSVPPSAPSTTEWLGPLRPGLPLSQVLDGVPDPAGYSQVWSDPRDAVLSGIDIRRVMTGSGQQRLDWHLELRGAPPRASVLDPALRVVEYGVVVDGDGDHVADCEIGINNDTPRRGDYRVWVTNLRTEQTQERLGGPYGLPFDFHHPDETAVGDPPEWSRLVHFFFLKSTPGPCDSFRDTAGFYVWAALRDAGRVVAWDFAPDAAWLRLPPG